MIPMVAGPLSGQPEEQAMQPASLRRPGREQQGSVVSTPGAGYGC